MEFKRENLRPIIGILSQDCPEKFTKYGKSYIATSYIKYIESAGARVAPIRSDLTEENLEQLFNCINGILLPGGGASLSDSEYYRTGKILYDLAVKAHAKGETVPILGTCLGFEMLHVITSGHGKDILSSCDAENYSIAVNFTQDGLDSRMFGSAPEEVINDLKQLAIAFNVHVKCVTPETYQSDEKLSESFKILSVDKDRNGKEFVSSIEGKEYPVYGTQWHPEKNQFEWKSSEQINHSSEAILAGQYMANFFVNQARLNTHHFPCEEDEQGALIYQYNPIVTIQESTFEQCYFF